MINEYVMGWLIKANNDLKVAKKNSLSKRIWSLRQSAFIPSRRLRNL